MVPWNGSLERLPGTVPWGQFPRQAPIWRLISSPGPQSGRKRRIPQRPRFAFTIAPHLQIINYRDCFSPFASI
jgi:hypothetical protein